MARLTPFADHADTVRWPVAIWAGEGSLAGTLSVPTDARGIVLFAHGSGSNRLSPRNRLVADALGRAQVATLLIDLLTKPEDQLDQTTAELRFDVELLTRRLTAAVDWTAQSRPTRDLPLGLFGASTGAAAAIRAAVRRPDAVQAVVSRGGRPDLAGEQALAAVRAPTLFIVGSADRAVVDLNRRALKALTSTKRLALVFGATHLFEEPGALDDVARLTTNWFLKYLR